MPNRMSDTGQSRTTLDLSYLEGTIGYALKRAQIVVSRDIHRVFDSFGITSVQFSVLVVAAKNPGASQADLASALGVERPRMVPVIDSLETRGFAERVVDPHDRRSRQIYLTVSGAYLLGELTTRFTEHERRVRALVGEEQASALLSTLRTLEELSPMLRAELDPRD